MREGHSSAAAAEPFLTKAMRFATGSAARPIRAESPPENAWPDGGAAAWVVDD